MGYWGGVRPDVPNLPEARVISPKLSPGLEMTMEDLAVDKIVNNGVGLVQPEKAHELYEGLHSHLEACGIDGVKVDVIHKMIFGQLTRTAYGDINGTYWLQGCHMVHCAYNSIWMGNFIQPDWDMFQSTHPCAEFHAASRAISGGPIYVSDAVGKHDYDLLKRLVFPDGSTVRCEYYALPTRDCLFVDPLHDGKTVGIS
ncbi:hypothetical protein RND81_02G083700 [Saponaria officinalis]|uniref:Uncharacterized protein n=1 Tax=Saponaria officinalis TaxID=3572 RepID=A0AAW1MSC5_SAPOF